MTCRAFIWAREGDGSRWPQNQTAVRRSRGDGPRVISPVNDKQAYARTRLFRNNRSGRFSLLVANHDSSPNGLNPGEVENARLLVPVRFGETVLRDGMTLWSEQQSAAIADLVPSEPRPWLSALERRGWTLLVSEPHGGSEGLPEVCIDETEVANEELERGIVAWLNPFVVEFTGDKAIQALDPARGGSGGTNKAIRTALDERHVLVAEMPIDAQRRVIGWQAIWQGKRHSALATLFDPPPSDHAEEFSAPGVDLALLDSFGGTFVAEPGESGILSWFWSPPHDTHSEGDRYSEGDRQIWTLLTQVLGLKQPKRKADLSSRFDWGVKASLPKREPKRIAMDGLTDMAAMLERVAGATGELRSGLLLTPILRHFAAAANRLSSEDAETIFCPLVDRSAVEGDHFVFDEHALLDEIQNRFFKPHSNVLVPLDAIARDPDLKPLECFGTSDFRMSIDPFCSSRRPSALFRDVVLSPTDGAEVADSSHHRAQWYDVFRRHLAVGHNTHAFRLLYQTGDFVLDRSMLDVGCLQREQRA